MLLLELYWINPLKNIRGVKVQFTRETTRSVRNDPCGESIQLTEKLGSSDSRCVISMRPRRKATVRMLPSK